MIERFVDPQTLRIKALEVVDRLKEIAKNHERTYPSRIEAVLVFSGPGTYYERLKSDQEGEWRRWMDRDRIRAGVAVVREVTASAKPETIGQKVKASEVTKEDIVRYGPWFVYNGTPVENEVFRKALDSEFCKLPKENVVIIDEVKEEDGTTHPIRHTGDQVKSFYDAIHDPQSPLFEIEDVALIAHIPDYVRIPFYTKKYNDEHVARGGEPVNFWAYGLRSRRGSSDPRLHLEPTEKPHIESGLPRLIEYAKRGHLAAEPSVFST